MKIPNNIDYDRYQWENAIDRWIFNEEHRAMLKRNLLDGKTHEQLADCCCKTQTNIERNTTQGIMNTNELSRQIFDCCRAICASTQNAQERNIYFSMLDKLNKR